MTHTAILLFVRNESEEIRAKGMYQREVVVGRGVFGGLNKRIIQEVAQTELPFFIFNSDKQVGDTFADRLKNAFQVLFEQGFDRVISVGNDVPLLSSDHIIDLNNQLNKNEVAFGKTQLGGVYAFALTKSGFSSLDFDSLDWQTNHLVESLIDQTHQLHISLSVNEEVLAELNSENDVEVFIRKLFGENKKAFSWLIELLNPIFEVNPIKKRSYFDPIAISFHFRGPPAQSI